MVAASSLTRANEARWQGAKVKPSLAAKFAAVAKRLGAASAKKRYQAMEARTGVPWFVIAVIHERESSQRWDRSIAQGDPWNAKSVHVPKGRGPFASWEDAAYDALMKCAPYAGKWSDWSAGGALTLLEHYNGLGYANKGRPSPYIWAGTDQYVSGKYVRDGVYDPNVVDSQLGCAGLILAMAKNDVSVSFGPKASVAALVSGDPASDSAAVAPEYNDTEDDTPPTNVQPTTTSPTIDVETVQRKLDKLGYHEVGAIDGIWGGKTAAAIAAYKNDRGLTGDPVIDKTLTASIDKDIANGWSRPVAPDRANVTAKDIAPKVEAVRQTLWQRFWAKVTGFGAMIAAAFKGASDYFDTLKEHVQPIMNWFSDIPAWVWFIGIGGGALLLYLSANKATDSIVDAKRTGRLN